MGREQHIIRKIAEVFDIEENFLSNRSMKRVYVYPRKVLLSMLVKYGNMSINSASKYCGYKSHATGIYHLRDIDPLCFQFELFNHKYKLVCDESEKVYGI